MKNAMGYENNPQITFSVVDSTGRLSTPSTSGGRM